MEKRKVVIIGSGPAGYTAALYTGRAQLEPLVFAGFQSGGQLMFTTEVENFPGFPEGIRGPELMDNFRQQAARFGATIKDVFVTAVDFSQRPFRIWTDYPDGVTPDMFEKASPEEMQEYLAEVRQKEPAASAEAVIIATGAASIMLGVPGESEFLGRGVSTCAVCDAAFYRGKKTFVVGGGDSAMEDSLALAKFADSVTILHRRDSFKASKIMQERVLNNPKIKVLWNTTVQEIQGKDFVEKIVINEAGKTREESADGVFIAIGHRPMTRIFDGQVALDDHGYVITRQSATAAGVNSAQSALGETGLVAFPSMTSVEGVFAAGDGVDVRYKQAITAAGQGCSAALDAERWLEAQE
jgi:thioredoxin reductase (NADPH)